MNNRSKNIYIMFGQAFFLKEVEDTEFKFVLVLLKLVALQCYLV